MMKDTWQLAVDKECASLILNATTRVVMHTMEHVTLVAITGTIILVPYQPAQYK